MLKYFEGDSIIVGTVIIPQGIGVLLFLLPLLGLGKMRKFGHVAGVLVERLVGQPLHRVRLVRLKDALLAVLQHLLQRREVMWLGLAEFEDHWRSILRPDD